MKKQVVLFFLFAYLFSNTELHQLAKLPVLITHFGEHKERNHNLSLLEFLYLHYAQTDDQDGDDSQDKQLPFKSNENCIAGNFYILIPHFHNTEFNPQPTAEFFVFNLQDETKLTSSYLSSIWQPPRV
jgi:hypothetical protein